jgi:hypothetical protein
VEWTRELTALWADADLRRRLGDAARRWANYVSGDEKVGVTWRYLLVSETDVSTARGSWGALKGFGGY